MAFHSPSHFNPKTNFKLLQNDSETGTVEPRLSGLGGTRVNKNKNKIENMNINETIEL